MSSVTGEDHVLQIQQQQAEMHRWDFMQPFIPCPPSLHCEGHQRVFLVWTIGLTGSAPLPSSWFGEAQLESTRKQKAVVNTTSNKATHSQYLVPDL